ncbi:MAG: MFS transporter [Erysipelotrichaceae bacterium]
MKYRREYLFCVTYFFTYIAQAISYCQLVSYLTSLGYSASQRGYMFALGAIVGMAAEFYIGYLCDKNKTIKRYVFIIYPIYAVVVSAIYLTDFYCLPLHLLIVGANQLLFHANMGVVDSWVMESGEHCKESFGAIRAFGSLGWVVGSYIVSDIVSRIGYRYIGIFYSVMVVLICVVCHFIDDAVKSDTVKIQISDVKQLFANKKYIALILAFFGTFMMQNSLDYVIVDKLNILNASAKQVGYYWMIIGLVELPLMFLGNRVAKKLGFSNILLFAVIVYGIRFLLYGFSNSVSSVMLISIMQSITFPLIQIASKHLIDYETPSHLKSSGQLIGLSLYSSTSALFAPLLVGFLEDSFNINITMFVIGLFSIFAVVFVMVYKSLDKSKM